MTDTATLTNHEADYIGMIPVKPAWLDFNMEPFARETHVATGVMPWSLYYRSDREQSIIDYQLMSFRRIVKRVLTVDFSKIDDLPMITNGRIHLPTGPWEPPKKRGTARKKAASK
jgi:hypothetical protein